MDIDTYTSPYRPLHKGDAVWVSLKQGWSNQYAFYAGKMARDYNSTMPTVYVLTVDPETHKAATLRVPRSAVCRNAPLAHAFLR